MSTILYIFIFLIGITFGSFFTLAVYRIPLHQNITTKRSYCPNCNHKLSFFDMIPIFSYVFLRGKCRYCHEKIRIRYLLLEILSGVVFVLFAVSIKLDISIFNTSTLVYFVFGLLYIAGLFIIAGIDLENININNGVLLYLVVIETLYIIYLYILENVSVYRYVIYLFIIVLFVVLNNLYFIKKLKNNYTMQIIILVIAMLIFTYEFSTIIAINFTLCAIAISMIMLNIKINRNKAVVKDKKEVKNYKIPIAYYLCVGNIISLIAVNFIAFYKV